MFEIIYPTTVYPDANKDQNEDAREFFILPRVDSLMACLPEHHNDFHFEPVTPRGTQCFTIIASKSNASDFDTS